MNPEFVFQTNDVQRIGIPKAAVLIGQVFRHEEQANAFRARRRTGQTRENQMADIAAKIIVTPCDIDLLA